AASIVAKVERDRYMESLDEKYPGYGFKSHAGYGVARHRIAIERLGVTPEHRLSFAPLATYRRSALPSTPLRSSWLQKASRAFSASLLQKHLQPESLLLHAHERRGAKPFLQKTMPSGSSRIMTTKAI